MLRWAFVMTAVVLGASTPQHDDELQQLNSRLSSARGPDRVQALNDLALHFLYRSVEESQAYAQQALSFAKRVGDRKGEGIALRTLGITHSIGGENRKALEVGLEALAVFEALGDSNSIVLVLNNLGTFHRMLKEPDQALSYFHRALSIAETQGNEKGTLLILSNVANVYFDQSQYAKALEYHNQAEEIGIRLGDQITLANTYHNMCAVYYEMGVLDQALAYVLKSLAINEKQKGRRLAVAGNLYNIGHIYLETERPDQALDAFRKSLAIHEEVGDKDSITGGYNNIGLVYLKKSNYKEAKKHFERALLLAQQTGQQQSRADALNNLGACASATGDHQKALQLHMEAAAILAPIGARWALAETYHKLGRLQLDMRRPRQAQRFLEQGAALAQEIGAKDTLVDVHLDLTEANEQLGDYRAALESLRQHDRVKQAIADRKTQNTIIDMQVRFEARQREQEIAMLVKNNQIQSLTLDQERLRRNVVLAGLVLAVLLFAVLFKKYLHLFSFWKRKSYIGHYRIQDQIGSGGMGMVYRAQDVTNASRQVAIKVIREELSQDAVQRQRFLHEASLVDRLDHPNIVTVYERGQHQNQLYMAMEVLDGRSLAAVLSEGQSLPVLVCVEIMCQLAGVMNKVHEKGIVHRDIKPDNIMLIETDGCAHFVKLLDFGLARSDTLTRLTEAGEILGSIGYLAPEQLTRQISTPASDVYALGVVFYEMVTSRRPFAGELPVDIIRQALETRPIEPIHLRTDLTTALNGLIMDMLSKDPTRRPSDQSVAARLRTA